MLTEKDYCNLEISDELRKLGYPKWPYEAMDMDSRLRIIPLYEAQKWLREEKKCFVNVCFITVDNWHCEIEIIHPNGTGSSKLIRLCNSYEEALLEGIKEAIKLLKEEK